MAERLMVGTIKSVEKAIALLFLFDGDRTVLDVKTISQALRIPLRTTYRLVHTLRTQGVLAADDKSGLCRVSPRLRGLLAAIEDAGDIGRICGPFLRGLADRSGETAQLFVPHSDEVLLIEIAESPHALRVGPRKGERIPLHCGAGAKAFLAFQGPQQWDAYIRRNGLRRHAPNTVTDPGTLRRQLRAIQRTRFAVSHQEFIPGVRSLGVPIQDATGAVIGSLGLVGPDVRLTPRRARDLKPLMLKTAARMTVALSGK